MTHDPITALQEELAHQSLEISRLSEELYLQQKEMANLRKQVAHFKQTLESLSHLRDQSEEEAPPHY